MLYINKEDEVYLNPKFHQIHNICTIIYDQLFEILNDDKFSSLSESRFDFDEKRHIEIEKFKNGEIPALEWLSLNNQKEKINEVITKHVTFSTLSDYLSFLYESLSSAKNGRMSVAYALLRKPFTDELLIFEQILINPENFIDRFFHDGEPDNYDPSNRKIDKKEIISNAIAMVNPNSSYSSELIYNLRYDKNLGKGVNGLSNHALHIVTMDKNYKTARQNLNFIFSNKEDVAEYWNHYYYFVPYLILYTASVIDNIVMKLTANCETDSHYNNNFNERILTRFIAFIFWLEDNNISGGEKLLVMITDNLCLNCDSCEKEVKLERADFRLFLESQMILCTNCFNNVYNSQKSKKEIDRFVQLLKNKTGVSD